MGNKLKHTLFNQISQKFTKKLEKQDFDIDLAYSNTAFFYSIRQ